MLGLIPGTAARATGLPVAMPSMRAGMEDAERPALMAAEDTWGPRVLPNLLLMITLTTADPKAPPMARAENARPVALARYAWGAVYWTRAMRRVRGPACPIPANSEISAPPQGNHEPDNLPITLKPY